MNATHRRNRATYQLSRDVVSQVADRAGVSRADDIADLFGIDRATYFRLLSGGVPRLDTALQMAEVAKVPVHELFPRQTAAA